MSPDQMYPSSSSKSAHLYERAQRVLPGGNTRTTVFRDPYPIYAQSGNGSRILDLDRVERIHFLYNYTALIHGHAHPSVAWAATSAVENGRCLCAPADSAIPPPPCPLPPLPAP